MQEESGNGTKGAIAGSIGTCLCAVRAGVAGTAERERAVTAYASIPSVRDLSGQRIWIEEIYPLVEGGRYPVKRIAREPVEVWADVFRDGHAVLAADLLWRSETAQRWSRTPMRLHNNDRWSASFVPARVGRYLYAIEAWTDAFATWRRDFITKRDAGLDVTVEMQEGTLLLNRLKSRAEVHLRKGRCGKFEAGGGEIAEGGAEDLLSDELAALARNWEKPDLTRSISCPLAVDRPLARAGAWYEMMPRSQAPVAGAHGTLERLYPTVARHRRTGFRRSLSHTRTSHRQNQSERPQQCVTSRAGRSRESLCDRLERGRT